MTNTPTIPTQSCRLLNEKANTLETAQVDLVINDVSRALMLLRMTRITFTNLAKSSLLSSEAQSVLEAFKEPGKKADLTLKEMLPQPKSKELTRELNKPKMYTLATILDEAMLISNHDTINRTESLLDGAEKLFTHLRKIQDTTRPVNIAKYKALMKFVMAEISKEANGKPCITGYDEEQDALTFNLSL